MASKEVRLPRSIQKTHHPDHGSAHDAFSCEMCSKTRQKHKEKKKKRVRQSKIVDGELRPKKEFQPTPIPTEGRPYLDHDTITQRYKAENPYNEAQASPD